MSLSLPSTRRLRLIALAGVVLLALSGCAVAEPTPSTDPSPSVSAALAEHGLAGLSAREIVDRLDAQPVAERPADLRASVRPDELIITDAAGAETSLPMPDDAFYLSIAPYLDTTHDCHFHSLTTCRGELADVELTVTVTDADGDILVDGPARTFDNGFVGFWLPRGLEGTVTVAYEGRTASAPVSTRAPDDATCLTTLHLT
ncbi:CueP family metal-binding protein [Microbacterium telephonicum]|uniref:Uncharacterized protein n=1 Tax=Microbacterium telephonicum TaxID=1714841 RepID=A0A498CID5_9MICO|nr:CueP family metal-binding protein [Microbacterium telephonicum]RLK52750.1 hypothetical protein C7474_0707 [Microbacterium telephonicum]